MPAYESGDNLLGPSSSTKRGPDDVPLREGTLITEHHIATDSETARHAGYPDHHEDDDLATEASLRRQGDLRQEDLDASLQAAKALLLTRGPTLASVNSEVLREVVETEIERTKGTKRSSGTIDEEATSLVETEGKSPANKHGLHTYELTCRRLGVLPVTTIKRSLKTTEVRVKDRSLLAYETLALCNALLDNSTVTILELDGNVVGAKGAEYLSMLLADNDRIHTLSLAENGLGSSGACAVGDMLLINQTIRTIDFSGNDFKDADAEHFAGVIKYNNTIRNVNLSHNRFGDRAAVLFGEALSHNQSLRSLDLSWNHIRATGAVALSRGIERNQTLCTLSVAMNGFSTVGCNALADALLVNRSILDLDLSYNRIYDVAAVKLQKALEKNCTLKRLHLSHNPLTTASAIALLTAIKKNQDSQITRVDMSTVPLYKDACPLLEEMESVRPGLDFLYAGIVGSSTNYHRIRDPRNAIRTQDPIIAVMEYITARGLRLLEFFKQFDKDGGGSISRDEFIMGLKMTNIPMTTAQLDDLIKVLDKDGDGEIDYGELIAGEKMYRQQINKMKKKMRASRVSKN